MLKETRMAKGLTLEKVEQATKIRKKYLTALEEDSFTSFPSQAYTKGFIKNYSEFLGLNSRNMMAFFRRQTEEVSRSSILPKKTEEALKNPIYALTPGRFLAILVSGLLLLFLSYFGFQYRRLQLPPRLTVLTPKEQTVTDSSRIEVTGITDSDATISINGIAVLIRSDGKFFDQVQLFPGKNTITIVATSRYGKVATVERTVIVREGKQ